MTWDIPPLIKVYEALGAIADKRVIVEGNTAKVYSSSHNKYYDVRYDGSSNSITSNDNASYYVSELGYPSIAFCMATGIISFSSSILPYFKDITWKDINTKYENDYTRTRLYVEERIARMYQLDLAMINEELQDIHAQVKALGLKKLESDATPPQGY